MKNMGNASHPVRLADSLASMWAHCGVGWVLVPEQSHERADAGPGPSRAEPGQGPSLRGTASLAERGVLDCRQLLRAVLCGAVLLLNTKRSHRLIVSGPPPLTWMSPKGHVATLRVWPGAGARHRPAAADACGGRGDLERRMPRWRRVLGSVDCLRLEQRKME